MPPANPPPYTFKPYSPPQHLLSNWTASELALLFQGFSDSLCYIENAPALVFERLLTSISHNINNTVNQERIALEECRREKQKLQDSVDQLRCELAATNNKPAEETREKIAKKDVQKPSNSITDSSSSTQQALPQNPIVEHEWVRLSFRFKVMSNVINVVGTTSAATAPICGGFSSWGDIGPIDSDFQHGSITYRNENSTMLSEEDYCISFPQPFSESPAVVLWITDMEYRGPLCVRISTADQDANSFTMRIAIGSTTTLRSLGVAWTAYETCKLRISDGFFNTGDTRGWRYPHMIKSGNVTHVGARERMRLFMAVDAMDLDMGTQFEFVAGANCYTNFLTWDIDAKPHEALLYSVGMRYLTIE